MKFGANTSRNHLALIAALAAALFPGSSQASEFIITSVVREIPMKSGEMMYRDFYINAGSNNGLKKGAFIDAIRKMTVFDNINSKILGDTSIHIARLKLIHVDKGTAIARLVKFYDKDETPLSLIDGVMIGDLIEVSEKQ